MAPSMWPGSDLPSFPLVLFAFAYAMLRLLMEILIDRRKTELLAEVLALRHQLRVPAGGLSEVTLRDVNGLSRAVNPELQLIGRHR